MHRVILPDLTGGEPTELEKYILEICGKHHKEGRALAFAFIVSDLDDPQITKVLNDDDYLNALHKISGQVLTVFYLNDNYVDKTLSKAAKSNVMKIELGIQKVDAPKDYSPKYLAKKLLNRSNLPSPSILFFQVEKSLITDYTFAQIRNDKIEDAFIEMKKIIKTAIGSLEKVTEENKNNRKELFALLKQSIDGSEFWKNAEKTYKTIIKIKDFLFVWKM